MSVDKRPYAGNWSPDILNYKRKYTTWTPDAIVLFNGDTKLPGCNECKNKIDFQAFITSVNCSGGTDSGSSSADISLAIPSHYGDSIFKDGEFLFQTGVEVNIYYRGFFEVSGLRPEGETVSENIGGEQVEFDLNKVEMRPYYPVFHGVVTSVSYSFSGGFYSASLSCANILHFWNNQKISTSAAYLAAKPSASRGSVRFNGHVYTNMTPHQIIYDLYRDSSGSADGVGWTFSRKSNMTGKTQLEGRSESLYSLSLLYWNSRFAQGAYSLRMYGASGAVYTGLQTTYLGNKIATSKKLQKLSTSAKKSNAAQEFQTEYAIKLSERDEKLRVLRQPDGDYLPALPGSKTGYSVADQKSFITDISAMGSFELFDTQYDTKLGIASQVADKAGYEFYQDVDGSLVFKPPFYNLDTSSSRVYRIENEDILDISFENQEPEYTYAVCKGGLFRNTAGLGMEGTWGVKSTYVDYRLVAKYGWKALEFDTTFFNNKTAAYYAAVVELEKSNVNVNGCSVTIPLRPEMRPGYPVYIPYIDCFYYVTAISHSFSFGSDCTTSLTLTARRKKFHAPATSSKNGIESVDLGNPALPPKRLIFKDQRGHYNTIGFPNVVMALDPTKVNPNHSFFRFDFHEGIVSNNSKLRRAFKNALILQAYEMKILTLSKDASADPNDDGFFNGPWTLSIEGENGGVETITLGREVRRVPIYKKDKSGKKVKSGSKTVGVDIKGTSALRGLAQARDKKISDAMKNRNKADFGEVDKEAREAYYKARNILKGGENFTVIDLIDLVQDSNPSGGQPDSDNSASTANILKLLDDKKSSFNPNVPGYYRYYSSSHPKPEHQAPLDMVVDPETNKLTSLDPQLLVDGVEGFVIKDKKTTPALPDEVVVQKETIKRGFKTKTKYSKAEPEIVPTKDILHLSFQYHGAYKKKGIYTDAIKVKRSPKSIIRDIRKAVTSGVNRAFKGKKSILSSALVLSVFPNPNKKSRALGNQLKNAQVRFKDEHISITEKHTTVVPKDKRGIISQTIKGIVAGVKSDHEPIFINSKKLTEAQYKTEVDKIVLDLTLIFGVTNILGSAGISGKSRVGETNKFNGYVSPIFPISDEKGYEVFGAYQYGRGLDIIPNGEFDSLLKRDATLLLTNTESDQLLEGVKEGNGRLAYLTVAGAVYKRLNGDGASIGQELKDVYFRLTGKEAPGEKKNLIRGIATALEKSDRGDQIVVNTPTRLRDLRPLLQEKEACDCRADNADIQIILAEEFLQPVEGEEQESAIVRAQKAKIESKVKDWSDRQASLQGETESSSSALPTNIGSRIEGAIKDFKSLSDFPLPKPPKD